MKKIPQALIIYLLGPVLYCCSQNKNSLQKEKLVGKVRSITDENFNVIDSLGKAERGFITSRNIFLYDEKGNMIKQICEPVTKNQIASILVNNYDGKGNSIKSIHYDEFGKETFRSENKFDDKGSIISSDAYDNGIRRKEDNSKIGYEYDSKNNVIEIKESNRQGRYDGKTRYQYDQRGNVIERLMYNEHDKLIYKSFTRYDSKNNNIEMVGYDADGSVASKYRFEYVFDNLGNWIIKRAYKNEKPDGYYDRKIKYY